MRPHPDRQSGGRLRSVPGSVSDHVSDPVSDSVGHLHATAHPRRRKEAGDDTSIQSAPERADAPQPAGLPRRRLCVHVRRGYGRAWPAAWPVLPAGLHFLRTYGASASVACSMAVLPAGLHVRLRREFRAACRVRDRSGRRESPPRVRRRQRGLPRELAAQARRRWGSADSLHKLDTRSACSGQHSSRSSSRTTGVRASWPSRRERTSRMNHRSGRPRSRPDPATPWPRGEARACKARQRQFESARCLCWLGADRESAERIPDRADP